MVSSALPPVLLFRSRNCLARLTPGVLVPSPFQSPKTGKSIVGEPYTKVMSAGPPLTELRRSHWRCDPKRTTAGLEGVAAIAGVARATTNSDAKIALIKARRFIGAP